MRDKNAYQLEQNQSVLANRLINNIVQREPREPHLTFSRSRDGLVRWLNAILDGISNARAH